jgi:general nucleoside transport system permease protein
MTDELLTEEFEEPPEGGVPTPQERVPWRRAGSGVVGALGPVLTTVVAFLAGGLVVAVTGKNPLAVYRAVFDGTGLGFFFHVGSYSARIPFGTGHMWFPWDTGSVAAQNLQQTLLVTTPIALTALALAFAFRCGLFNIGGQGQYLVGLYAALAFGSALPQLDPAAHVLLCLVLGAAAGSLWAGVAGVLKAAAGAHEVISTIMLNWIAVWVGSYLVGAGGPLQASNASIPVSQPVVDGAKLPVFWGLKELQGLSIGIFVALAMLVVYWVLINRTTLGFGVRAVGFNAHAARAAGIPVARNYVLAMAVSGAFAGLAGAIDITGWEFQLGPTDIQISEVGFIGLAAALLGRNTALGVGLGALLFGGLINGTSGRQLDPSVFPPDLASNLATIIQGLVVLCVGLNLAGAFAWLRRRRRHEA